MNIKFYLLTLLIIGGYSFKSQAQVSYNKRAMGVIGTAPDPGNFLNGATLDDVDKSTGTLRIGIPLYEIKVNDISVPITLNYTATGLKVGQEAGVAGMGWELNAGGKVITNVQGRPDHQGSSGISSYSIPEPFNYEPFPGPPISQSDRQHFNDIVDGKADNAWDTYTYILPNGGGAFTEGGLTYPYDPSISVNFFNPSAGSDNITTSDGLVYVFYSGDIKTTAKINNYVSSGAMAYSTASDPHPTVWQDYDLRSITSTRFKDVVNFKYQTIIDPGRLNPKTRLNVSESLPVYRDMQPTSLAQGGITLQPDDKHFSAKEPILNKSITSYTNHTVLDTIDYPTGMVVFDYNPDVLGRDVLNNIRIYKKTDNALTLLKRYEFIYYSQTTYGHYLAGIKIYDSKNAYQDAWQFSYKDNYLPVVPNANSKAQDRWGFYNGATANLTLLEKPDSSMALKLFAHYPINANFLTYSRMENQQYYGTSNAGGGFTLPNGTVISQFIVNYADRRFNFTNALEGTLTSVTTPTGATYQYNYEPHYFSYQTVTGMPNSPSYGTDFKSGGGIRIKSIINKRGHEALYYGSNIAETAIKKVYLYGNATAADPLNSPKEANGLGQVSVPWTVLGNISAYYDLSKPANSSNFWNFIKNMIMLSNPVNDLVQYNGSYVMYTSVTEMLMKDSTTYASSFGKTIYYSNLPQFNPHYANSYSNPNPYGGIYDPYSNPQNLDPGYPLSPPVNAPYLAINTGIQYDSGAGVYAIRKMATNSDGSFRTLQNITYSYEDYFSPQNSTNHKLSYYVALAGQASGAVPLPGNGGLPDYSNPPVPISQGSTINTFSASIAVASGAMDYVTRSYLYDQGLLNSFQFQYDIHVIDLNQLSYCKRKTKEVVSDMVNYTTSYTDYKYENHDHMLPTLITKTSAIDYSPTHFPPDTTFTRIYYPQDYGTRLNTNGHSIGSRSIILSTKMGITEPILQYSTIKTGSPRVEKVIGGTINTFKFWDNAVVPDKVYSIRAGNDYVIAHPPVYDTDAPSANVWENVIDTTNYYKQEMSYDMYKKGQVSAYTEGANKPSVILWGYNNQYPVAKITNAGHLVQPYYESADVAYTSFEAKDTCNWLYAGNPVLDTTTISGKKVYNLASGAITKVNATPAGSYIVSYWYKSGAAVTVTGGTIGAAVIKSTLGPWVLAEREVSNVTGTLTVSGTGYIDELRFYPKYAQMTTYTYDPPIGITSVMDANGRPQYYEYDNSQRLMNIRDHNGNILKTYKYIIGLQN